MGTQLLIGTAMIAATVVFHVGGLVSLAGILRVAGGRLGWASRSVGTLALIGLAVSSVLVLHTAEAWGWAALYVWLGEFSRVEDALYFSAVTATTLGYGDLTLSPAWRLLGAFEAMGGLILFAQSTAFLIELTRRALEPEPRP